MGDASQIYRFVTVWRITNELTECPLGRTEGAAFIPSCGGLAAPFPLFHDRFGYFDFSLIIYEKGNRCVTIKDVRL